MQVQSLSQDDHLEKGMVTHSGILAWGIPWTEEPGRLQSMGHKELKKKKKKISLGNYTQMQVIGTNLEDTLLYFLFWVRQMLTDSTQKKEEKTVFC